LGFEIRFEAFFGKVEMFFETDEMRKKKGKVHYIRYNRPPLKIMNIITLSARPIFFKRIPKYLH
jgi:hypothetical protein